MGTQKLNFLIFYLADQVLDMRSKVKYLGHILKNDLCDDDDDAKPQHCKLHMQANIRPPKFYMLKEPFSSLLCLWLICGVIISKS